MPDWTQSMKQTYRYFIVDPATWGNKKELRNIESSSVTYDLKAETIGTASFKINGEDLGECYVRPYVEIFQNGKTEMFPLGTFLVQTPTENFNGMYKSIQLSAYSPLLEVRDIYPPIGYTVDKDANIMQSVYDILRENVRVPVVKPSCAETLIADYVADPSDSMLKYLSNLLSVAKHRFDLDELGRIGFMPIPRFDTMQPVWTYEDDNKSILYHEVSTERDLYGIPNVVEVVYSGPDGAVFATAENNDNDSPTSIKNRGRRVMLRDMNPSFSGTPTIEMVQDYADKLLEEKSSLEYTVTYSHGFCPVRIGQAVRLNYSRAGLYNVKAFVTRQNISCEEGCKVEETATFTRKLWERK